MNCPYCNMPIEEGKSFCGNCGSKLNVNNVTDEKNDDVIDAFLSEMEGTSASEDVQVSDKTEAVFQETKERLFLDDNEDEEDAMTDEEIVNKFFDNLDSLEEDAPMELNKNYIPNEDNTPKIMPVFESVPEDIDLPQKVENTAPEESFEDIREYDDYSDIVVGGGFNQAPVSPVIPPVTSPLSTEENIADTISTENVSVKENVQSENNVIKTETLDDEPHILIDERPDNEQKNNEDTIGDFKVNPATDAQTPYLDSFINRPDINVDFENYNSADENTVVENNNINNMNTVEIQSEEQNFSNQISATPSINNESPMINNNPVPLPVKKKSKSKTGIIVGIVVAVVVSIVALALVFGLQFISPSDKDNTPTLPSSVINEETTVDSQNDETTEEYDETTIPTEVETIIETEPTTEIETKKVDINNPDWKIIKKSSVSDPLIVGEATTVKRYFDDTKSYENVQMKVSKIHRGEKALKIAKDYEANSSVKFEIPSDGIEYVIVEYQVYVPSSSKTDGTLVNLPIKIRGNDSESVIYKKNSYTISTWCINDGGITDTDAVITCQEIFQMPVGCTDYYLVFGTKDQSPATYKGQ